MAGMAGKVLAVPPFSHALRLVGMGYTVGGECYSRGGAQLMNVVCACNSKRQAAHVSLSQNFLRVLTSRLPDSFFHSYTFSIEFFRSIMLRMTWKAEMSEQCSAKHEVTTRAHPDN